MKRRANGEGTFIRLADGRYRLKVQSGYNANGNPRILTVTGSSMQQCKDLMRQKIKSTKNSVSHQDYTHMTLLQLCLAHLEYDVSIDLLKHKSIDGRKSTLNNQIAPYRIAGYLIDNITPQDVDRHINDLAHTTSYRGTPLSASSIKKAFDVISGAYTWIIDNGIDITNPCDAIRSKTLRSIQKMAEKAANDTDVIILSSEDTKRLKRSKNDLLVDNPQLYRIAALPAMLILATGMRDGEACALRWSDYDSVHNTLRIDKTRYQSGSTGIEGYIQAEGSVKNYRSRIIQLEPEAIEALEELQKLNGDDEYIITNKKHNPTNPSNLGSLLNKLYRIAGLNVTGAHVLRHTYATIKYDQGVPLAAIAAYLGDRESTILNNYIANRKKYVNADGQAVHAVPIPTPPHN